MPNVALISDIHANVHALRAVLRDIDTRGVKRIVCCGDVVGYGPHPAECVRLIRDSCELTILGNHDEYTLAASWQPDIIPGGAEARANPVWAGVRHAVKCLSAEDIRWLATLPRLAEIPGAVAGHAALHDLQRWPYLLDQIDALPTLDILDDCGVRIGFFGHTHRQEWFSLPGKPKPETLPEDRFRLAEESVCAVVVGSVGQPRTGDNRAAWTLWDSDARSFAFMRTAYPYQETARDIREAGLPESSARRLAGWL